MLAFSLIGHVGYAETAALQQRLVEARASDLIEDTVLFLEHRPVITRGRGLQWTGETRPRHEPIPAQLPVGMEFSESERGGDLTYHGPGQLVIYPIFKLDGRGFGPARDVTGFLRKLEQTIVDELKIWGISGSLRPNATGVWVGDSHSPKKIASMGIAIRKWVTYHGVAINLVNDLSPFHLISPCGYSPEVMTRLSDLTVVDPDWRARWELGFCQRLGGTEAPSPRTIVELEAELEILSPRPAVQSV